MGSSSVGEAQAHPGGGTEGYHRGLRTGRAATGPRVLETAAVACTWRREPALGCQGPWGACVRLGCACAPGPPDSTRSAVSPDLVPRAPCVLASGGWFLRPRVLLPSERGLPLGPPSPPVLSSGHLPLATSFNVPGWILHLHLKTAPPPCPLLTGPLGAHPGAGTVGLE